MEKDRYESRKSKFQNPNAKGMPNFKVKEESN
jgi:hypothetical protein